MLAYIEVRPVFCNQNIKDAPDFVAGILAGGWKIFTKGLHDGDRPRVSENRIAGTKLIVASDLESRTIADRRLASFP